MLFQRLYNWIKYKTLPPSFLFKNRLFIERETKHRRIFTNLGLTFRNSKWSNYETYNIKNEFKSNYLNYVKWVLLLALALYLGFWFNFLYIKSYFFNNFFFILWVGIDFFDYYFSFIVWFLIAAASLVFNSLYSFFFFNNFSVFKLTPRSLFLNLNVNNPKSSKNLLISKNDLHLFTYSWLTNSKTNNPILLSSLFETTLDTDWWSKYSKFFSNMYKISYYLTLSSKDLYSYQQLFLSLNQKKQTSSSPELLNFIFKSFSSSENSKLYFYSLLNLTNNYFSEKYETSKPLFNLTNNTKWNLFEINSELKNHPDIVRTKTGMFFIDSLSYTKLNNFTTSFSELADLNQIFNNQLNAAKWNRWLYRYSLLHRKILKNSHKLTMTKKLLSPAIFDQSLANKNLWFVANFSTGSRAHLNLNQFLGNLNVFNVNKLNELDFSSYTLLSNFNSNLKKSKFLNFFEQSYFWNLKRFFMFNTIPSNFIHSQLDYKKSIPALHLLEQQKDRTAFIFQLQLSSLLKTFKVNFLPINFNHNFELNPALTNSTNKSSGWNYDTVVNVSELDFFSKDFLNILNPIVTNLNYTPTSFNFFSYLFSLNLDNLNFTANNNFQFLNTTEFKKIVFLSLLNPDVYYLNDLNTMYNYF